MKKIWFIIVLIVFIACANRNPTARCDRQLIEVEKFLCIQRVAINKVEYKYCDEISNLEIKETCYKGVAITARDPNICTVNLTKPSHDTCLKEIAILEMNSTICSNILDYLERDQCYFFTIGNRTDTVYCDNIKSQYVKIDCNEQIVKTLSLKNESTPDT